MARTISCLDLHFPDLAAHPDLADHVSLALDDLAPAAIHESGDDVRPTWRVFLADPSRLDEAAHVIDSTFGSAGVRVSRLTVEDEDWAARSQAHLTRIGVGRLTVAPPWDAEGLSSETTVIVHPSTGFGTGHHQSTRLCLRLLQDVALKGRRLLDLGTGSGVLALAAWRLGAASVEGIDYDQDAIDNALENAALNAAQFAVVLRRADLRAGDVQPGDVVTANLTGALLVAEAAVITALVAPGGTLVAGGFDASELDAVVAAFAASFTQVDVAEEDTWRAVRFERA